MELLLRAGKYKLNGTLARTSVEITRLTIDGEGV